MPPQMPNAVSRSLPSYAALTIVVVAGNISAAPMPSRSDQPMRSIKTLTLKVAVVVPIL